MVTKNPGERWAILKRSSKIDYELRAQSSKSLWLFFLLATGLARKISVSIDLAAETAEKWIDNPLRHSDIKIWPGVKSASRYH